jgi:hypothetical protein
MSSGLLRQPTFRLSPPLFICLWELGAQEAVQLGANLQSVKGGRSLMLFHI